MSEKNQKATPYKLQKAKEKGQVSKSLELTSGLSFLVILGILTALWPKTAEEIKLLMVHLLQNAPNLYWDLHAINSLAQFILLKLISLWLPLVLCIVLAIILATIAQTGLVWTTTPLTPDFKRLNPALGFKKIFSLKTCFESFKSIAKLGLAFGLFFLLIKHKLPSFLQLGLTSPWQSFNFFMQSLLNALFQLVLVLFSVAILDKGFSLWHYQKDQRMTKQELKDEYKQREGDPKIKAKIRQLQQQLRQKTASLSQVKNADVIITNPTHLAIALQYEKALMPAPKVICKARDEMALEVKKIAQNHNIPIVENKAFARSMFQSISLNHYIGQEHYRIASDILREIFAKRVTA